MNYIICQIKTNMSNSAIEKLLAGLGSILFGTHFAGARLYTYIIKQKIREETILLDKA